MSHTQSHASILRLKGIRHSIQLYAQQDFPKYSLIHSQKKHLTKLLRMQFGWDILPSKTCGTEAFLQVLGAKASFTFGIMWPCQKWLVLLSIFRVKGCQHLFRNASGQWDLWSWLGEMTCSIAHEHWSDSGNSELIGQFFGKGETLTQSGLKPNILRE